MSSHYIGEEKLRSFLSGSNKHGRWSWSLHRISNPISSGQSETQMTFGYIHFNSSAKNYSPVECDAELHSISSHKTSVNTHSPPHLPAPLPESNWTTKLHHKTFSPTNIQHSIYIHKNGHFYFQWSVFKVQVMTNLPLSMSCSHTGRKDL